MEYLKGKKTYIVAIVTGILVGIQAMGWWVIPNEVWGALGVTGAATLRAGIKDGKK